MAPNAKQTGPIEKSLGICWPNGLMRHNGGSTYPVIKSLRDDLKRISENHACRLTVEEIRVSPTIKAEADRCFDRYGSRLWPDIDQVRPDWLASAQNNTLDGRYPRDLCYSVLSDRDLLRSHFHDLVVTKCWTYRNNHPQDRKLKAQPKFDANKTDSNARNADWPSETSSEKDEVESDPDYSPANMPSGGRTTRRGPMGTSDIQGGLAPTAQMVDPDAIEVARTSVEGEAYSRARGMHAGSSATAPTSKRGQGEIRSATERIESPDLIVVAPPVRSSTSPLSSIGPSTQSRPSEGPSTPKSTSSLPPDRPRACDACRKRRGKCVLQNFRRCDWCRHRMQKCTFVGPAQPRKRKFRSDSTSAEATPAKRISPLSGHQTAAAVTGEQGNVAQPPVFSPHIVSPTGEMSRPLQDHLEVVEKTHIAAQDSIVSPTGGISRQMQEPLENVENDQARARDSTVASEHRQAEPDPAEPSRSTVDHASDTADEALSRLSGDRAPSTVKATTTPTPTTTNHLVDGATDMNAVQHQLDHQPSTDSANGTSSSSTTAPPLRPSSGDLNTILEQTTFELDWSPVDELPRCIDVNADCNLATFFRKMDDQVPSSLREESIKAVRVKHLNVQNDRRPLSCYIVRHGAAGIATFRTFMRRLEQLGKDVYPELKLTVEWED